MEEAAEVTYTILSDTITGVLQITTFEPKNHSIFINTIQNGLLFFKENLVQQLIIDLSQNGGGDICLGYSLFRSLFPNENPIVGSYDMKSSQLFELFANAGASLLHQNISNHQVRFFLLLFIIIFIFLFINLKLNFYLFTSF